MKGFIRIALWSVVVFFLFIVPCSGENVVKVSWFPQELKQGADNFNFNDPDWLGGMLKQVRPMLLQRLMRKGASK